MKRLLTPGLALLAGVAIGALGVQALHAQASSHCLADLGHEQKQTSRATKT